MLHEDIRNRTPEITDLFHRLFYDDFENTWTKTSWMGVPILKCPLDLWVYQEIIAQAQPDTIIETGTAHGGSALFYAHIMDIVGHGQVLTIDIAGSRVHGGRPVHPRIDYIHGSSVDARVLRRVESLVVGKTMVVLDSDHSKSHVLAELRHLAPLVTPGQYLVVEDTNLHGHPVEIGHPEGPWEALEEWDSAGFERALWCEKFYVTFQPGGWWMRT